MERLFLFFAKITKAITREREQLAQLVERQISL